MFGKIGQIQYGQKRRNVDKVGKININKIEIFNLNARAIEKQLDNLDTFGQFGHFWTYLDIFGQFGQFGQFGHF